MKKFLELKALLIVSLTLAMIPQANAQLNEWAYAYDDVSITNVSTDPNGNVYYTGGFSGTVDFDPGSGESNLTASGNDIFILKLSSAGSFVWVKQIEAQTSSPASSFTDLSLLANASGVYLLANTIRPYDLDPGSGTYLTSNTSWVVFLISLDADGDLDFVSEITGNDDIFSKEIAAKSNGDLVIVGGYSGTADFDPRAGTQSLTSDGLNDPMILTLTGGGAFVSVFGFDGPGNDLFTDVAIDNSNNVWVTGYQRDYLTVNGKNFNAVGSFSNFILEVDASGVGSAAYNWGSNDFDPQIAIDPSTQEVYIACEFLSSTDFDPGSGDATLTPTVRDVAISKFNTSGIFQWVVQEGGASNDYVYDIEVDEQSQIHFAGNRYNSSFASADDLLYQVYDSEGNMTREEVPTQGYITDIDINRSTMNWAGDFQNPTNNFDLCGGSLTLTHAVNTAAEAFLASYTIEEFADAPTISASESLVCGSGTVTLTITDGDLNDATSWEWYSGSCGGTSEGSGTAVMVSPSVTTTYYARGEGYSCNDPGSCVSVTITVSEAPTDISLTREAINENESIGTLVGILSSTDATSDDTHTYSLVAGSGDTDNGSFTTDGANLNSDEVFDHEMQDTYAIRIQSEDLLGCTFQEEFTITINDVTPEEPTDIALDISSIAENNAINDVIGSFSTTDDDTGEDYTYTLVSGTGDTDNDSFNIDGDDLRASEEFDFETKNSYSIRVQTDDDNSGLFAKEFTITIDNVTESANDILTFSIPEETSEAAIDNSEHTVTVTVPYGTDLSSLTPTLTVNSSASVAPASGVAQNFNTSVTYTVTAEDNAPQDWVVTVIAPIPAGTYTIDAGQDFTSLSNLLTYLNVHGISGDVTFELSTTQSGSLFSFEDYPGTDQHSFTLKPAAGASDVDLNASIQLNGIENFTIDGMGAFNIDGGVTIQNGVNDASKTSKNVTISGTSLTNSFGVWLRGVDNVTIDGNTIRGVAVSGAAQIYRYSGILVNSTTEVRDVTIRGNDIYFGQEFNPSSTQSSVYGLLQFDQIDGYLKAYNNTIRLNPAQAQGAIVGLGAWADDVEIYHNTILLEGGDGSTLTANCINTNATSSAIIKNNILDADVTQTGTSASISQVGIYLSNSGITTVEMEENNITFLNADRTRDGYIRLDSDNALDEDDLATIESQFPGTTYSDVTFVDQDNGDYQLDGTSLNDRDLRATPLAEVTTDIEGAVRSSNSVTKGAFETPNTIVEITSFTFTGQVGDAVLDQDNFTITAQLEASRDLTDIAPTMTAFPGASINPESGVSQDFTDPFVFLVTAEASNTQEWTVTITYDAILWNGTAWNNSSGPGAGTDDVIIDGDYNVSTDGYFDSRDLTVNSGATLTVDGESSLVIQQDLVNNGSIVVESGSDFTNYSAYTITGNDITFKRNTRYADGRYSFVGSPVQQDASIVGSDLGSFIYKYNEATPYGSNDGLSRWEDASSDELVPGKGYTQAHQQEIVFVGMPNQGTITIDGTYTEDTSDDFEGWMLVANPYPAPIDVADFLSTNSNTSGSIYIWDDNGSNTGRGSNADYIVANGTMATNTTAAGGQSRYNQTMGSMQAFFIKLNSAADVEIEFNESMRVTGNSDDNFFREVELPVLRINLQDDKGLFKQTVMGLAQDAITDELNRTYDAQAFSAASDFGLYTLKAGRSLALNGMPLQWESVQLQVNVAEVGYYSLDAELKDYEGTLFLRDNLTEDVINLSQDAYSFHSEAGIHTNRFELLSADPSVLAIEKAEVLIYAHDNVLHIRQEGQENRSYQVFNLRGQLVLTKEVRSVAEVNVSTLAKGVYLVFDGERTHKVLLK